jgi:hypothetical protein
MGRFPNVLGAIDGTLISIKAPRNYEKLYVSRKGGHSSNVLAVAVCDPTLRFSYVVAKYPGSSNDSFIWANCILRQRFQRGDTQDEWLLGDSGKAVIVYWQFFSSNLHWYTNVNLLLSYVDYK